MKLITVTIPCYNSAGYMKKCIDSVLTGGNDVEIIIIDDGSTDDTGKIADEYAKNYPSFVKVIHQENGGHGEGINQGLRNATGKYFKVVDSDDWLSEDEFKYFLKRLKELDEEGGVDLITTNYVYEHFDRSKNSVVKFVNVFMHDKVCSWKDTLPFLPHQYLTIHTSTFRTEVLRECKLELPKHIFYEDNLFVITPLPYCKKLVYFDIDLYRYFIGRDGQSVQEEVIKKRYLQQIEIAKRLFFAHDIEKLLIENKKLGKYVYHESVMLLLIAVIFARLNKTDEAERAVENMWQEIIAHDRKMGKKIRYRSLATFVSLRGKAGRGIGIFLYKVAHGLVKFN